MTAQDTSTPASASSAPPPPLSPQLAPSTPPAHALPSCSSLPPLPTLATAMASPSDPCHRNRSCTSANEASISAPCCRICLDNDSHGLYSPCRCRGSIKFVHSHCLTRWRKSLMAHGREGNSNSCSMCGFNYVLKKRARFYELISFKGVRLAITFLTVVALLFPSGYIMKFCVILSQSQHGLTPFVNSFRNMSDTMDQMNVFPICKAGTFASRSWYSDDEGLSPFFSGSTAAPTVAPGAVEAIAVAGSPSSALSSRPGSRGESSQPVYIVSLFPGTSSKQAAAPSYASSYPTMMAQTSAGEQQDNTALVDSHSTEANYNQEPERQRQQHQQQYINTINSNTDDKINNNNNNNNNNHISSRNSSQESTHYSTKSMLAISWAWILMGVDGLGSSRLIYLLTYPFVNDRIWFALLCRMQHLHLGFFFLGSASNVYMACEMLSDMYDLLIPPPNSTRIRGAFMTVASVLVFWFWFKYNLMAFQVSATEEEFMSELPLWALRLINVGVAIIDLSYRRIYNRLGRLKVEEELMDISEVERLEEDIQKKALQDQQQWLVQYGQEQGLYLLDQFNRAIEINKQSILSSASAAADAVSEAVTEVYAKTSPHLQQHLPSLPTLPTMPSVPTSMSALSEVMGAPFSQLQLISPNNATDRAVLANAAEAPETIQSNTSNSNLAATPPEVEREGYWTMLQSIKASSGTLWKQQQRNTQ